MRCISLRDLIRALYDLLEWKVREEKVAKKKIEYYLYDSNLRPPDH